MARLAQTAQVRLVVGAAVVERDHVVDLSHGRVPATGQAVLAQRVGFDVGRADLSPPVVVASVDLRVALVGPVAGVLGAGVLGAEPRLGQLGAAGVGARALGFERHPSHRPLSFMATTPRRTVMIRLGVGTYFSTTYSMRQAHPESHPLFATLMRANASVSAEQETREAGKGALLLGEGSLAFDVEVFGDFDGGVLGGEVVEEEDLEDQPVIVAEAFPGRVEPIHVGLRFLVAGFERVEVVED